MSLLPTLLRLPTGAVQCGGQSLEENVVFVIIIIILNYYFPLSSAHLPLPSSIHGLGPTRNSWPTVSGLGPCWQRSALHLSRCQPANCASTSRGNPAAESQVVLASFLLCGSKARSHRRVVGLCEGRRGGPEAALENPGVRVLGPVSLLPGLPAKRHFPAFSSCWRASHQLLTSQLGVE